MLVSSHLACLLPFLTWLFPSPAGGGVRTSSAPQARVCLETFPSMRLTRECALASSSDSFKWRLDFYWRLEAVDTDRHVPQAMSLLLFTVRWVLGRWQPKLSGVSHMTSTLRVASRENRAWGQNMGDGDPFFASSFLLPFMSRLTFFGSYSCA
eukprot:6199978-Pleurochrysis_carterae.AAC.3